MGTLRHCVHRAIHEHSGGQSSGIQLKQSSLEARELERKTGEKKIFLQIHLPINMQNFFFHHLINPINVIDKEYYFIQYLINFINPINLQYNLFYSLINLTNPIIFQYLLICYLISLPNLINLINLQYCLIH